MSWLPFDCTSWFFISSLLHVLAFTGIALHALKRRRDARATLLWLFIAWSFPLFGALLYIAFGIDRAPRKGLAKRAASELVKQQRREKADAENPYMTWEQAHRADHTADAGKRTARINQIVDAINPGHPLLDGNHIEPLISGDEAYPQMIRTIRSAEKHIHMQSFIINKDEVGRMFMEELKAKASEGVSVRLLYDTMGSAKARLGGLFREYRKIPNFRIFGWTQANPLKRQFQINHRNHRKNLVVDGQTAFFGGVNIERKNRTSKGQEAIRDYHFKVRGPLVNELQFSFLCDWHFISRESISNLLTADCFPLLEPAGKTSARLIDSGPSSAPDMLDEVFFNTIVTARKQILITTPYFVPTIDLIKALRSTARRGVDVCIIVPKHNNHKYAGMASKAFYEELLAAEVRIFQRNPPFLHAKSMVVDGRIALVGTANFDIRSLDLNYETTVLVAGRKPVREIEQIIRQDLADGIELTHGDWLKRPVTQQLAENLFALLTPIL